MAIETAYRNHSGGHCCRDRATLTGRSVGGLLGMSALVLLSGSGCSKGGAPDLTTCIKLTDPMPGDTEPQGPMRTLYAELRTTAGSKMTIPLDGSGGTYSGSYMMGACDEGQSAYNVAKVVLVDINGDAVATANYTSGTSYTVTYQNGMTSAAGGTGFTISTSYSAPATPPPLTVQNIVAGTTMARQGDTVPLTVGVTSDLCGTTSSQWWLTPMSTGTMPVGTQTIAGASGSATLHIPPTAAADTYFVEGLVTLKGSGHQIAIHRPTSGDQTKYSVFDTSTGMSTPTTVPVSTVMVAANPDADKVAPQAISVAVSPMAPVRCGTITMNLHISDDKGLPPSQKVKLWLGPASQPTLYTATVIGGEYLSGMIQVPLDAPSGVWYVYPDVITDAAGNEAKSTFSAGKFTLSGPGVMTAQPIDAGTFVVPTNTIVPPDMATPLAVDMAGLPDMATQLPAMLTGITVMPNPVTMANGAVNVTVSWTDNAHILK